MSFVTWRIKKDLIDSNLAYAISFVNLLLAKISKVSVRKTAFNREGLAVFGNRAAHLIQQRLLQMSWYQHILRFR